MGFVMVTPSFLPVHKLMKETIEELFSILGHGHKIILGAALRTFLRIASRVNVNAEISSDITRGFLAPQNDFPDVLLIEILQVG